MSVAQLNFPPFRLLHAAYVTRDLEAGKKLLEQTYGVTEFKLYKDMHIQTPDGYALVDFVLANANGFGVEAIHPRGAQDAVYRNALPDSPDEIVFHHLASRVINKGEWAQVLASIEDNKLDVLVRGRSDGGINYIYLDTRKHLGHIHEFLYDENDDA